MGAFFITRVNASQLVKDDVVWKVGEYSIPVDRSIIGFPQFEHVHSTETNGDQVSSTTALAQKLTCGSLLDAC